MRLCMRAGSPTIDARKHDRCGKQHSPGKVRAASLLFGYRRDRRSYMSAHVLMNLLNEFGKRDKMRGLPSILSLFRNEINKLNNSRARMLDSIYHMTLRFL